MKLKNWLFLALMVAYVFVIQMAFAEPVSFKLSEKTTLILPLQLVGGVQLYSPEMGKGFPGVETVLLQSGSWRLSAGAAPIIGTSENVPFASVSTRLSPKFFDTADNDLYFGVWIGKPSDKDREVVGISASIALW
jgi:hypothetical protein